MDSGKENGNYYIGFRIVALFRGLYSDTLKAKGNYRVWLYREMYGGYVGLYMDNRRKWKLLFRV